MNSKFFLIVPLLTALCACQMSASEPLTPPSLLEQEHQIAEQIADTCEVHTEDVADIFDCEAATAGVIPIIHPEDEIQVPLAPVEDLTTEVEADLWMRIAQQLQFSVEDNPRIEAQRNWYLKHPSYMQRVAKRATPFLHLIVEELESQNLPLELALLPIVESAFDPFAYSHGRAAGMWQFIPGTAKRFGMKQNWWYDGRRDVVASTKGALAYLSALNKMFDGNWLHALASYNSGEGRVRRAIRKNKKLGKGTDFWQLDLPKETRAYVPKLLALADILKNQQQYGYVWPSIDNRKVTEVVDVGSQIDLALAAEFAGLTLKELHALNPGYNRWATDPDGPFSLLLPVDKIESFTQALSEIDEKQRLNWVRHKIKSGDSILKLAKQYHTSADVIKQVNELDDNLIKVGKYLIIPVALKSLEHYSLSKGQRLASTQKRSRGRYQLSHKVEHGDTLWDISRAYKVEVSSLAKWNGMAPRDPLKPGKTLVIWKDQVSESQAKNAVMRSVIYTVRKGDSLARIADKFNVKTSDLGRWNQLSLKKYLQPGQKLKIFVDITRT